MAEGGINPREERIRRRDLVKQTMEREANAALVEQGVLLSDEEVAIREQAPIPTLMDEYEEISILDENQDFSLQLSESESENEYDEYYSQMSSKINEKRDQFQKEKAKVEEKMLELQRRESLAAQREKELARRREEFEKQLREKEERERVVMRKKLQEEMYAESIKILKSLEDELLEKQRISREREEEISRRERELQIAEEKWRIQELELEKKYKENMRQEIKHELTGIKELITRPKHTIPEIGNLNREDNTHVMKISMGSTQIAAEQKPYENVRSEQCRETLNLPQEYKYDMTHSISKREIENNKRDSTSLGVKKKVDIDPVSLDAKSPPIPESSFYMKPYIGNFSGSDPKPKQESSFEDWKLEVESLIAAKIYPEISISQAIRKSLKGQAKKVLLPMGPTATPSDIIKKLESVFGNVASGEAVLQEFYTAEQSADETVADWGLRLEEIIRKALDKGHVEEASKNEMLRNKFWRSLYNQDLKNATRIYFESEKRFEELRRKIRAEEYEMNTKRSKEEKDMRKKQEKHVKAQHQPVVTDSTDQMQLLQTLMDKMSVMEKDIKQIKQRPRRRWRGKGRRGQEHDSQDANENAAEDSDTNEVQQKDLRHQQDRHKKKTDLN